jgi:hypothetical protein
MDQSLSRKGSRSMVWVGVVVVYVDDVVAAAASAVVVVAAASARAGRGAVAVAAVVAVVAATMAASRACRRLLCRISSVEDCFTSRRPMGLAGEEEGDAGGGVEMADEGEESPLAPPRALNAPAAGARSGEAANAGRERAALLSPCRAPIAPDRPWIARIVCRMSKEPKEEEEQRGAW